MIRFIVATNTRDRGVTFWTENKTPSVDVHTVPNADTRRLIRWWGRRDRNKPVTDLPRRTINATVGFRAPDEDLP